MTLIRMKRKRMMILEKMRMKRMMMKKSHSGVIQSAIVVETIFEATTSL